jgi:hypothetical protein
MSDQRSKHGRDTMRSPKDNSKALAAFLAKKAEIDAMLVRIANLSDDHFGADPDKVNWGDVGSLEDYARHLRRITDAAFREGKHAE